MTNKTLSQELSELANIEPKCLCEIVPDDDDECNMGFPCYVCEAGQPIFPDFENNNDNFVRLLEIVAKTYGFVTFFDKKDFLQETINDCDDGYNKLSKDIQSEKWSY